MVTEACSMHNRMANKRKSVAIPVDYTQRRFIQSVDEVLHINIYISTCHCCSCVPPPFLIYLHIPYRYSNMSTN